MSEMKRLLGSGISADAERILRVAASAAPRSAEKKQARIIEAGSIVPTSTETARTRLLWRAGSLVALAIVAAVAGRFAGGPYAAKGVVGPPETAPSPVSPAAITEAPEHGVRVEDLPGVSGGPLPPRLKLSPTPARDELAEIDAARAALTNGGAIEALARLDHWRAVFSSPRYAEEAEALQVQALAALGRREEARVKGERFLASRPHSPYARRIRVTIGEGNP